MTDQTVFKQLRKLMEARSPQFAGLWTKSALEFGGRWEEEISRNITRVFGEEASEKWNEAVDGYAEFCVDALRAQVYYEKHGTYQNKDYDKVLEECYHSSDYMERRYLPGQYLSHYIWPHHQRMLRHYLTQLLPKFAADVKLFYEVGVGCGMYSQKTLELLSQVRGKGFDISDYSLNFTMRAIQAHGYGSRYSVHNQNIITEPISELADLVISQEVLEHLSDPQSFVDGLYRATRAGGWGYITAAVNASHTDHIYHYRSPKEVQAQLEKSGWRVLDIQIEEQYPEKPEHLRPTIAGYLVRKDGKSK